MSSAKALIVNADDLGRTPGINDGIFEAHERGLVTSATLMVAYPAAEKAAIRCETLPDLGIGLHVQLSGGTPVLPPEQLPSLVDAEGRLPKFPDGLGGAAPDEVMAEAKAQFDRFLELCGRLPTHLDSHHHSHRNPMVCDALIALARDHHLPIRNASPDVKERVRQEGLPTNDHFVEKFFGEDARLEILLEVLRSLGPGITEIMCHPAHVDEELRSSSSYAEQRQQELEILTNADALQAVKDLGLRTANFSTAWCS
ncbi:MAG: carbohydrate deacetylase [Acidobacteriota bacterium]